MPCAFFSKINLMKLELKHLAPYLPFKVKIMHFDKPKLMNGGQGSSNHWIGISATLYGDFKPILRPLSELFDFRDMFDLRNDIDSVEDFIRDVIEGRAEYKDMSLLLQLHFDVFNLIPKGLAVDVNTLEVIA
jgi:hypothetical protein